MPNQAGLRLWLVSGPDARAYTAAESKDQAVIITKPHVLKGREGIVDIVEVIGPALPANSEEVSVDVMVKVVTTRGLWDAFQEVTEPTVMVIFPRMQAH